MKRDLFVLTYGWTDMPNNVIKETHDYINTAEKNGETFLAAEKRFASIGHSAPAFYQIDRYNFDVIISRKEN